jgi:imidazolonepropionase-like amidohydrolase
MKKVLLFIGGIWTFYFSAGQETFPLNDIADRRDGTYAFTNATIIKDPKTSLNDATLIIRDGKIIAVGTKVTIPEDAVIIDCKDKYIYPAFIDIYSDYGTTLQSPAAATEYFARMQITSNTKGAYGWNQAIKSDVDAYKVFAANEITAKLFRDIGFSVVLTHVKDGIARGSGALVSLGKGKENMLIIKERASANYSFNKGSSTQTYPTSVMGSIALLRQTYLDAQWYKHKPAKEGINLTLAAWNNNEGLPQIFDADDKWNVLRADRIGDETGVQYIIKGGGNEYQRIKEIAGTKAIFILSLNFPQTQDVEDPNDARFVSLTDLKHWELAPTNPVAFEKAGIPFCLTPADLRDPKMFLTNIRTAINYGLSKEAALSALTTTPATALGVYNEVGSLDAGKLANFLITSGPIFNDSITIYQNWIQGKKYSVKDDSWKNMMGSYKLVLNSMGGPVNYTLNFINNNVANLIGKDTVTTKFYFDGRQVRINVAPERQSAENFILSGIVNNDSWNGYGVDTAGNRFTWTAVYNQPSLQPADSSRKKPIGELGRVMYPFKPFGWEEGQQPKQETLLFKNVTVWTNEKEGILANADVLIRNGKIAAVGKVLSAEGARIIDGRGKHLTPGIIDEHSHIASASINEAGQSVTSEVRIQDNLNPDDINIYRQLSGGVTTSHILHGSANTIGGQTQLIKMRWGANDEDLKFKGADPFIKFALGENVKRTLSAIGNNSNNTRFPDTRTGVQEVLVDAFTRARDYENSWKAYNTSKNKKGLTAPRKDLELDALVEILNNKRFITCHSYIQSEITSAMRVAERMGYHYNTFTHILEGYKVADKMKAHGANASTFSDWWNYKMEVVDAIPYNAALMQQVGLNVAINSDDAEMARRLNQEAAKSVKYGGMSEEAALKMVTLNPAKMLHIDKQVGSIKVDKDADLVLWSDNPMSIYAKSLYTIIDGIIYFDREKDALMRKQLLADRSRIIRKMNSEKRAGIRVSPPLPTYSVLESCEEHNHSHGLLTIDSDN